MIKTIQVKNYEGDIKCERWDWFEKQIIVSWFLVIIKNFTVRHSAMKPNSHLTIMC